MKSRHGPAAVKVRKLVKCHWRCPGRRRLHPMNLSQKNCLFDNHRLTCERWGGDYRTLVGMVLPCFDCSCNIALLPGRRKGFFAFCVRFSAGKAGAGGRSAILDNVTGVPDNEG